MKWPVVKPRASVVRGWRLTACAIARQEEKQCTKSVVAGADSSDNFDVLRRISFDTATFGHRTLQDGARYSEVKLPTH